MWSKEVAETRREIIEATVEKTPGLSFRQVVATTKIPSGTVRHHINVLAREGRVWYTRLGGRLAHFAGRKPTSPIALREVVAASFDKMDARIYLAVRDEGPLVQKDILERFGDEPISTVQHRVKRLVRFGILSEQWRDRYREYNVSEGLA